MTEIEFRKTALNFPGTTESSHMNHPDFRVSGKIFATLGYPNDEWGMVKLTPDQQSQIVKNYSKVFVPVPGGWGLKGGTNVCLRFATKAILLEALEMAWANITLNKPGPSGRNKRHKQK